MVFLVYLGSSRCYSRAPGGGRGLRGWAGHPALSGALCPLWSRRYSTGLHTSGGSHERFLKSVFLPVGKHTHLNTQSAAGPVFIVRGQLPAQPVSGDTLAVKSSVHQDLLVWYQTLDYWANILLMRQGIRKAFWWFFLLWSRGSTFLVTLGFLNSRQSLLLSTRHRPKKHSE